MKRTALVHVPEPVEEPMPEHVKDSLESNARAFRMGECFIIVGSSLTGWHLSISCPDRYPTWDEIAKARYALIPGHFTMAMFLPPKDEYVNLHDYCFQLHQVEQDNVRPVFDTHGRQIGWERRGIG